MAKHVKENRLAIGRRIVLVCGVALCLLLLGTAVYFGIGFVKDAVSQPSATTTTSLQTTASFATTTAPKQGSDPAVSSTTESGDGTQTERTDTTDAEGETGTTDDTSPTQITSRKSTTTKHAATTTKPKTTVKPVPSTGELRAVWVSYIELDGWLQGGASAARQKIDKAMDDCVKYGLNTVFFHVRSASNAYYKSSYYPLAPSAARVIQNGLDPLAYAVQAAHSRGLELHAWINPYRAGTSASPSLVESVKNDAFLYSGRWYYDPSSPAVQALVTNGVREVCANYGVDGVHFDDYFYPENAFSDATPAAVEAARYRTSGATSLAAWRCAQVTSLLKSVYQAAHTYGAVFGVSPLASIAGNEQKKYADVRTWVASANTIDYICPQVYYGFNNSASPFTATVDAWCALPRHASVKLYIGLGLYKAGMVNDKWAGAGASEWASGGDIFARELATLRSRAKVDGFALYSYDYLNAARFASAVEGALPNYTVARKEIETLLAAI